MSVEKTPGTGVIRERAGSMEIRDPRVRRCPPAPPPPRISEKIADSIKVFEKQSSSDENKSLSSSQSNIGPLEVTQAQIDNDSLSGPSSGLELDAAKSATSTGEQGNQVKTGQLSRSSSPYSPSSPLRDDDEIMKDQSKIKADRSSEDMIELMSSCLKTRDASLEKYRRNFHDLRKVYDTKKAELKTVQTHVKELRKQVESVSREKKEVQLILEKKVEELRKVKEDLKTLKDEKEAKNSTESEAISKLKYTQVALDGQKLLADMHYAERSKLENENANLKKAMVSRNERMVMMSNRIKSLEAAIQADVNDKNVMVGSFNLYMASTQRRVEELFVQKVEFMEDPRLEGSNVSSMSHPSQLTIKGENDERTGSSVRVKPPSPTAERIAACCNPPNPDSKQAVVKKEEKFSEFQRQEKGDDKKRKEISTTDDDDSSSSSDSVIVLSPEGPVDKTPNGSQNKKHKVQ